MIQKQNEREENKNGVFNRGAAHYIHLDGNNDSKYKNLTMIEIKLKRIECTKEE